MPAHQRARALVVVLVLLAGSWLSPPTHATPRYAARYRQNCNLCHHNPTGGGMRSLYASQFLVPTEMAIERLEQLEGIQPKLSESVTAGVDLRTAYHHADHVRPATENNFFQMQGTLYVAFQVDPRYSAYLARGQSSTLEVFGLGYVLPFNGYMKFGRFTPDFGWKLADHRQFTRSRLFFEPPAHTDVGLELGMYPGRLALSGAVLNGARGSTFDLDEVLAWVGRAAYRFDLGAVGFALGGSFFGGNEPGGRRRAGGPFGSVQVGPLTWVGELDWSSLDPRAAPDKTALVTSHEVTWRLHQGFDIRAVYDYEDPDLDFRTGLRTRVGAGFDTLPTPFFGVQAMGYHYRNDRGLDVDEDSYTQAEVVLHVFY